MAVRHVSAFNPVPPPVYTLMASPRSRRRGSPGEAKRRRRVALVALAIFFLIGVLLPTGAFSLVDAARVGSVGVAEDADAELGMFVYTCVAKNSQDPLITVTNNLEEAVDVTVGLVDTSIGTLYINGKSGNSVTFPLSVSDSDTVEIEASAGGPYPNSFDFTIDAAGSDTSVSATRSSAVYNNCGSSTPTPTPTATATPIPGNDPPVADFTMSRVGNSRSVDVDASPSDDPDGTIVSYEWDVGADGTIDATGQTARLTAPSGTEIKLIVTDNDGATDSTTKTAP